MAETTLKPTTIPEIPFPTTTSSPIVVGQVTGGGAQGTIEPIETAPRSFPSAQIASDVISSSLDTQSRKIIAEYSFSQNGAIRVGSFEAGVSGELAFTPAGIVAKNKQGETTFTIDASTGDATFKGTIAANSLIAGRTDIGTRGGNVFIDGTNNRIIISDGVTDRILIGYQSGGF